MDVNTDIELSPIEINLVGGIGEPEPEPEQEQQSGQDYIDTVKESHTDPQLKEQIANHIEQENKQKHGLTTHMDDFIELFDMLRNNIYAEKYEIVENGGKNGSFLKKNEIKNLKQSLQTYVVACLVIRLNSA